MTALLDLLLPFGDRCPANAYDPRNRRLRKIGCAMNCPASSRRSLRCFAVNFFGRHVIRGDCKLIYLNLNRFRKASLQIELIGNETSGAAAGAKNAAGRLEPLRCLRRRQTEVKQRIKLS